MTRVNPREEFGPKFPTIPAALVAADSTVLQIKSFERITARGRPQLVIEFRQAPKHYLWPSVEELEVLCEKVSDDDAAWVGAEVALVKAMVKSKRQGNIMVPVWQIASAAKWDEVMKAYQTAKGSSARSAARASK